MNKLILVLLILITTACGKAHIDPAFISYSDRFYAYAKEQNFNVEAGHVSIEFGEMSAGTTYEPAAQCNTGFLSTPMILVSESQWYRFTDTSKEMIILHEMGHCLLNRVHSLVVVQDSQIYAPTIVSVPHSIMHYQIPTDDIYFYYHDKFIHELFYPGVW